MVDREKMRLMVLRFIWFALLMSEVMFLGVAGLMISQSEPVADEGQGDFVSLLFKICLAMMFAVVPMCYVIRGQIYKRGWEGQSVKYSAYQTGNIIFWAGCEVVASFSIMITLASGEFGYTLIPAAVCMGLQALSFPTGGALRDAGPEFAGGGEREN